MKMKIFFLLDYLGVLFFFKIFFVVFCKRVYKCLFLMRFCIIFVIECEL